MTPAERAARRAETWRMVTLGSALLTLAATGTGWRWALALGPIVMVLASERYRWWVNRKWDEIEEERALR